LRNQQVGHPKRARPSFGWIGSGIVEPADRSSFGWIGSGIVEPADRSSFGWIGSLSS
jgi:hypothetical protein